MHERIKSPCYGVCTLDSNSVCIGCKRTQSEIKEWAASSDNRRLEILENCKTRKSTGTKSTKIAKGM